MRGTKGSGGGDKETVTGFDEFEEDDDSAKD
jgi:hypothetical protein